MVDLSVVILNFNTRDFLKNCLDSLSFSSFRQRSSKYGWEVIVVDNASTDGSVEMVKQNFPWVTVVKNEANLGFAGGNNRGLGQALGRYVLFLNSDTRVPSETLSEMVKLMDNDPWVGAATCYVESRDGTLDKNCHRGFPTPLNALAYFSGLYKLFPRSRLWGGYYQSYLDLSVAHEVDAIEGAFMMVRREAGEQAAMTEGRWWDEDFFFFGEDLDFCFRLKEKGWKIFYYPQVKIWHYKGATHGFNQQGVVKFSLAEKAKLVKSTTDAMRLFYQKHYLDKYPRFVTALVLFSIDLLGRLRSLRGGI